MHFSFSEETYTKKEAWDNSEISTVKCVSELSLGSRPFSVGDSMQLPFFFFSLFVRGFEKGILSREQFSFLAM